MSLFPATKSEIVSVPVFVSIGLFHLAAEIWGECE